MDVTQVTVEIHEKRNHPYEYGHYDASVTLTATIEEDEYYFYSIETLRNAARDQVQAELDGWIAALERERQIDEARNSASSLIASLRYCGDEGRLLSLVEEAERKIRLLPVGEQGHYLEQLSQAWQIRRAQLKERAEQEESDCNEEPGPYDYNEEDDEDIGF